MPHFAIGDLVELNGLLGELHGGAPGKVVSVFQHKNGISALDEYEIVFEDSTKLRLWSFQLAHAGNTKKLGAG